MNIKKSKIIDSFIANNKTILVFDCNVVEAPGDEIIIDNVKYSFGRNSVKTWAVIDGIHDFKGKEALFL